MYLIGNIFFLESSLKALLLSLPIFIIKLIRLNSRIIIVLQFSQLI